jgi:hypothetical protein
LAWVERQAADAVRLDRRGSTWVTRCVRLWMLTCCAVELASAGPFLPSHLEVVEIVLTAAAHRRCTDTARPACHCADGGLSEVMLDVGRGDSDSAHRDVVAIAEADVEGPAEVPDGRGARRP